MCVREVYDQSVLQFTINHKVCFALPRYTSRVIHRSKFSEYVPIPHPHAIRTKAVHVTAGTTKHMYYCRTPYRGKIAVDLHLRIISYNSLRTGRTAYQDVRISTRKQQ